LNILFVNISIPGEVGDTNQWEYVIKGLEELGHRVTLVVSDGDPVYFDSSKSEAYKKTRRKLMKSNGKEIQINGIRVLPIHCISSQLGLYCPSATNIAKKIVKKYDVVYILNWYYHLAFVFSKVCSEMNVPVIVAGMGSLQDKARNLKKYRKKILDQIYTKKMISNVTGLHSVGELETKEYIQKGSNPKKIFKIDHGVMQEQFQIKNKTSILEVIGLKKDEQYIVSVSRLDPKKGVEILIDGFEKIQKKIPDIKLVIVGTGTEEYVESLKKKVSQLNLNEQIKFSGFVSDDEKIELLNEAKIFVMMSHSDVHPLSVVEALATGTPVIVTKASDFPEIDEYDAGITVDTDSDAMCEEAIKLLKREDFETVQHNAKQLISEKFHVKHKIKEYESMFLKVIKNNN